MSQNPDTSVAKAGKNKDSMISLNIYYCSGFLYVKMKNVKDLNVTSGKIYARSHLTIARKSDEESDDDSEDHVERRTAKMNNTDRSNFEETILVN